MSSISFTVPSNAEDVRWACLAVRGVLEGIRIDEDEVYQVELAVSEAVTNKIRHAYGNAPDHEVEVHVTLEAKRLVVEVMDSGTPLDAERIKTAALPGEDRQNPEEGGRGLFLINETMDEVWQERRENKNVFIMVKAHDGIK